jgi:hypothetical protein
MEMIDRELKITRYTEGAMLPEEKRSFLAEVQTDPELRDALEAENAIQNALHADAAVIEQNIVFDATPGAPLVERLAATTVSSDKKTMYYLIGAATLLAVLALLLFRSEPPAQNPLSSPIPKQIEQSAPEVTTPAQPENPAPQEHVPGKTEIGKSNVEVKTLPKTQKNIDLDQDIKGKPKVFTDPKGHMPIK